MLPDNINIIIPHDIVLRPGFICLIDGDTGRSITNDADNIIQYLVALGYNLTNNRIIYKDTMGYWDELLVANNRFADFRSIHEKDLDAAIAKAKGRTA